MKRRQKTAAPDCISRVVAGVCVVLAGSVAGCSTFTGSQAEIDLPSHLHPIAADSALRQTPESHPATAIRHAGYQAKAGDSFTDDRSATAANGDSEAATVEADGVSRPLDLEGLIDQALASNPKIHAARAKVAALANRVPQVTALPDPTLSNSFFPIHDNALQTAGGRIVNQLALGQKVPWPEKLDARGTVAAREADVARAEVAEAELEVVEAVKLAYYDLWLAQESVRIVEDNKGLVSDLIEIAEARYATGGSQQDVLRAELEADKLDDQLIGLRRQVEQARAALGALVRRPVAFTGDATDIPQAAEVAPQLENLIAAAERSNPSLQGLAAQIARDRAKERVACLEQYPDLQFGLGLSAVSTEDALSGVANGNDNLSFTVGITLPIWRDRIDAGMHEAAHETGGSINRREAERDRIFGELRRQVAAADAAAEQVELFNERLIPRTEQTLELAAADYQGERTDFFALIDIYRELLAYQVQVVRGMAMRATALARLERLAVAPADDAGRR